MKKIIKSGFVVLAVAAIAGYGTYSYFSDTEKSTGNTFTAGALDLVLQQPTHTYQGGATLNGTDVPTFTPNGVSFALADLKPLDWGAISYNLKNEENPAKVCVRVVDKTNVGVPANVALAGLMNFKTGSTPLSFGLWADLATLAEDEVSSHALDYCFGAYAGGVCVIEDEEYNPAQKGQIVVDIEFYAEQTRNNSNFTCASLNPAPIKVGAALGAYVAPTSTDCNVNVAAGQPIQAAINDANTDNGETVCVAAGTYNEDVVINKSITLAGAGQATTIINGQIGGEAGAVGIAANNVTVKGFSINAKAGAVGAMRFLANLSGANIAFNKITANGATAVDTQGGQSNHTFSNNEFVGNGAGQLVYVNGAASLGVANASTNIDFTSNTFSGTIVSGGIVLGNEAGSSAITKNVFDSTLTSTYTILEAWQNNILVNENNFHGVGGVKVTRSTNGNTISDTTNAENNWWGTAVPAGHFTGLVDDDPKEASAFLEN